MPLHSRLLPSLWPLVAATLAFALYVATLSPTVTFVDSGELIVAAHRFGVAHPPGFPLYTAVTGLLSFLPVGSVAKACNLASAIYGAIVVGLLALLLRQILRLTNGAKPSQTTYDSDGILACCGALLFACSLTFWGYSNLTEVYTFTFLFVLGIAASLIHWLHLHQDSLQRRGDDPDLRNPSEHLRAGPRRPNAGDETGQKPLQRGRRRNGPPAKREFHERPLLLAALLFGLGCCAHHVTMVFLLPFAAVLIFGTAGWTPLKRWTIPKAALVAILGLLPYASLPLIALREPELNWGNPHNLERLWWHVSARQYSSNLEFGWDGMSREAGAFIQMLLSEFHPVFAPLALVAALAGAVRLWKRSRVILVAIAAWIGANLLFSFSYQIAEDKDAYYLTTFLCLGILATVGCQWLPSKAVPAALLLPLLAVYQNYPLNDRSNFTLPQHYANAMVQTASKGGVLLTSDWQIYAPLLYYRSIEKLRPDLQVLDIALFRRSWYLEAKKQQLPAVPEVDTFLSELRLWEKDPEQYLNNEDLVARIDNCLHAMLEKILKQWTMNGTAVYVTGELVSGSNPDNRRFTEMLLTQYRLRPNGLNFQVADKSSASLPPTDFLPLPEGGPLKLRKNDVITTKVYPAYLTMLINSGLASQYRGENEKARAFFKAALLVDPQVEIAKTKLKELEGR